MVALQPIIRSNQSLSTAKPLVALFVGATSGIGLSTLKEFTSHAANPRVYFVARNAAAAASIVDELRALNQDASVTVIERNVSLIKDAERVAEFVREKETALDVLFLSVGFFSLDGRQETSENLEASLTTRYYSRIRITQLLLPLLNKSASPHVVSILAGGKEEALNEDDLGLSKPKSFSVSAGNAHSTTMMTLALEHLAAENPRVSFVHAFPGLVATPLLGKISSGVTGFVLKYFVAPLLSLFAKSVKEAGQRGAFLATSARYSVDDGIVPLVDGLDKAEKSKGGVFVVDENGEAAANEKVLEDLRKRGVEKKVWEHTLEVFNSVN